MLTTEAYWHVRIQCAWITPKIVFQICVCDIDLVQFASLLAMLIPGRLCPKHSDSCMYDANCGNSSCISTGSVTMMPS